MKHILYLFLSLLPAMGILSQSEYKSLDYRNYRKALDVIQSINIKDYNAIELFNCSLSGSYFYQGHYPSPRQRKEYNLEGNITWTPSEASLMTSLVTGKDTLAYKETVKNESIVVFNYGETAPLDGSSVSEVYLPFLTPVSIYHDILNNKQTIRYLGVDEKLNADVLVYTSSFSKQVSIHVNRATKQIDSAHILKYEDIEGDYYLQFIFNDYKTYNNFNLPTNIVIKEWNTVKYNLKADYKNISVKKSEVVDTLPYSIDEIAENLYKISYPTKHHYSYIIDYGNWIGIIEAPISEIQMQTLHKTISDRFPSKPIKYCFLTHHHPDHAGGFPYFYKNGAIVVTTELSSIYQRELLNKEFSLRNEDIEYSTFGELDVIHKGEAKDYSTNSMKMIAYEFGDNGHTTEFLLYYFPESKTLIAGDLFYINTPKAYASVRANKLYEFINENNLQVEKIYTTWMPENARIATIDDLITSYNLK